MKMIICTILSYICFGFMLDVSTQSLGKNELKDADLLKNIQLEVNVFKDNYHKLLLIVQQDGKEIKFLKKQNQDLKQKLDNTINKTDTLMKKEESFDKKIEVLQHDTLRKLNQIKARNRKSRNSVRSSLTLYNNSLQEVIKDTNNLSKGHHLLIAREEMKIFEKKIRDENDKVIDEIESAMDSFMKNVSFNNTLVTDKLQKMSEDVVELTTRVTHQESSTDRLHTHLISTCTKLKKTVAAVEELKANDMAMESFMKHVSSNNTLVTSKLKQMTEEATETQSKVTHQESSIYWLWSQLIPMSSKLEKIVLDVAELKTDAELSCRPDRFTCTKQFQCIPASKKCDGEVDCYDKTDEEECAELSCRPERFTCTKQFQCIPASSKCDSVVDCYDKTDEEECDTHTMCNNGGVWQKYDESYICVCAAGFLGKQCEYSDGKDTGFMVVFHEGLDSPSPMILVASANTENLSIRYFNNNVNQTISIDKRKTEQTLSNYVLPSDGIHLAGVEVHSDVRINLHGFVYKGGNF